MSRNGSRLYSAKLGATVLVPYITTQEDESTDRNWARLNFVGPVNRRRVKREIRKWVKRTLERSIDQHTLRLLCKQVNYY